MKPAAFKYFRPETVTEALALLDEYDYDAKILSGGQSLIPMMNMRLARPQYLIDINGIHNLSYINVNEHEIEIGGLTRHYMVENSVKIKKACPMLAEGMKLIGHSQIRSRGTVGGSIVHADPTAELTVILSTLGGSVVVVSSEGERTISSEELFLTYMTTSLGSNEILKCVQFPKLEARTGHAIEEFTLRSGDFAIVIAAASVTIDEEGLIGKASLCLGGVDGVPLKLDDITNRMIGQSPDGLNLAEICLDIRDMVDPEPDVHASADYRKDLSETLSQRVLIKAIQRATQESAS